MVANISSPASVTDNLYSESGWISLYSLLLPLVKRWVYSSNVYAWIGQEADIVWDIVLAAIQRTFEYALNAQNRGVTVTSLKYLSVKIAKNYYRDLWRKDRRIVRFDQEDSSYGSQPGLYSQVDPSELAFNIVYIGWLFIQIANLVITFPYRTRTALLIDLASRMHFDDTEVTPLQQAFLLAGIRLQDYADLLPEDPTAKSRHAALLSLAYKRLTKEISLDQQDPAA